ncbi:MAG TPA: extracellular solute-binding protein, partial [Candidatus Atribacteria bacterium]|nr:extracellular solute-binding protein [Candidatus Atribacteria bacterium]
MKKEWKWMGLLIMSVMLASTLSGCIGGAKKETPAPTTGTTTPTETSKPTETITMLTFDIGNFYTDEFYEKTGIKVELVLAPQETRHDKAVTSFVGGNPYDVVEVGQMWTKEYAAAGWLEPLDDRITPEFKQLYFDCCWESGEYEGHYYSIPWLLDLNSNFTYNEAMLKEAGLDHPPKTWDEFVDQCLTIKEKGICKYPVIWKWNQDWVVRVWQDLVYTRGGDVFDENMYPIFNTGI